MPMGAQKQEAKPQVAVVAIPRPDSDRVSEPASLGQTLPPTQAVQLSLAQVRRLLRVILPLPSIDLEATLALLCYQQRHKAASYRSHRKRRLQRLADLSPRPNVSL